MDFVVVVVVLIYAEFKMNKQPLLTLMSLYCIKVDAQSIINIPTNENI